MHRGKQLSTISNTAMSQYCRWPEIANLGFCANANVYPGGQCVPSAMTHDISSVICEASFSRLCSAEEVRSTQQSTKFTVVTYPVVIR